MFNRKATESMEIDKSAVPEHIAIIMDGNGRWAKKRLLGRSFGHRAGGENLRKITYAAADLGVKYLTVYAFSTENWKRPKEEIDNIMDLFLSFFEKYKDEFKQFDCRLRFMGKREGIPKRILTTIEEAEEETKDGKAIQLIIAFNYGGRQEILDAVTSMANKYGDKLKDMEIMEETMREHLYITDVPDPDLIIRSSGEMRISNYLLWQSAYSEFWVSDILWPDFSKEDLKQAIIDFQNRNRRFGGI